MDLRIVRGRTAQAGQIDEMATRWETVVGARISQQPGFRHAYFVGNRETNAVAGVTLWEALPDAETTRRTIEAFREQVADIITGEPAVEDYEVLVEL